jgi:N-acetylglucosamine kinase-like BadF-type ATPase
MRSYLLIDGGQSGCRAVHVTVAGRSEHAGPAGLSRGDRDRAAGLLRALEAALRDAGPLAADVVVAGLTGFDDSPETGRRIAGGLRSLVRTGRVVVTNDAVTSYLGAMGFEPGAVVAAGTGVIALAGDRSGNFARGDGWGYILGDAGGGYYVGCRGLESALRAHDGRKGSRALLRKAVERFGLPEEIKARIYSAANPAGEVAGFAREVAAAAREGDPVAAGIWDDAARELAATVVATLGRVFEPEAPVTVSWAGNLFRARNLLLKPFQQDVAEAWPAARLQEPRGTALDGAELLAKCESFPMFSPLIPAFEE